MPAALFDTLKASRTLQDAGLAAKHAEAIVETVVVAFEDTVASRADIVRLEASIEKLETSSRAELTVVKEALKNTATRTEAAEIRAAVADSFSALYRHLWIMALGIVTAMVGLSKLLDWLLS